MTVEEEPMIPEPADPLLRIGEFARRSRLSLKALRLYERVGLMAPAHVGLRNGYRWYAESQLFTARLIVLLRRLDMPLAQVAEVVAAPGERGADVVAAYWEVVERRIAAQRELVALMETSLRGGSQRFGIYEFREREVPEQLVLTGKRHLQLHELEGWLDETKRQLTASAVDHGGMVAGLFVIYHGEVSPDSDGPVEVCVPISMAREVPSDRTMRREPAHREAYVSITKAQFEVPQILSAYDAVATWIDSQGLRCLGRSMFSTWTRARRHRPTRCVTWRFQSGRAVVLDPALGAGPIVTLSWSRDLWPHPEGAPMSTAPRIVERAEQPYVAIQTLCTMRTASNVLPPLVGEVLGWLDARGVPPAGAPLFKYNVIDMERELEVEVGVPVATAVTGDGRVVGGVLPAGRYVIMTHIGHYDGLVEATGRLLRWGASQGLKWDMSETEAGQRWGARLEIYETDPQEEPDPGRWATELAFRLAD